MLKELCETYDQKNETVEVKKKELELALAARSEVVHKIASLVAPKKKFIRAGKELTIVIRGETAFFRGSKQESGLVEID